MVKKNTLIAAGKNTRKKFFEKSMVTFSETLFADLVSRKQETASSRLALLTESKIVNNESGGNEESGGDDKSDWVIDADKKEITADVEIPYSWFFKYNKYQFSYSNGGSNGICEYVAFLMMMSYYDFFISKGYFSDEEINAYVSTIRGKDFKEAIPDISDDFVKDLFVKNGEKETLNLSDMGSLFKLFMNGKTSVNAKSISAYWLFGNPKDVIKKGRPDMLCGIFPDVGDRGDIAHNIVAYGYFNKGEFKDKFLTHYGWDYDTQCIVDRGVFRTGYDWSIQDNTTDKQDRYIFDVNGTLQCGRNS